ncbi:MAG: helix-hairpin-helix domain-containing protein [Elusimicrobiota bacterium]
MKRSVYIKSVSVITFILILCRAGYGAFEFKEGDVRASGLSGAYTGVSDDAGAIWWNPAGLRLVREIQVKSAYTNLYGVPDLDYVNFSIVIPTMLAGTWALGFSDFGPSEYRENDVRLAFAAGLGSGMYIGTNIKRETVRIGNGGGTGGAFGMDLGITANVNEYLRIAASALNINNPRLEDTPETLPKRFMFGVQVKPYEGFNAAFDIHKPLEKDLEARVGVEITASDILTLRAGTQIRPSRFSFGFSVTQSIFTFDYAFRTHSALASQHLFSLGARFGEHERKRMEYNLEEEEKPAFVGKIDINRASVFRLMRLPGVGNIVAKQIVEYREKSGKFKSIKELMNIYGFSETLYSKIEDYITIETIKPQEYKIPAESQNIFEQPIPGIPLWEENEHPLQSEEIPDSEIQPASEEIPGLEIEEGTGIEDRIVPAEEPLQKPEEIRETEKKDTALPRDAGPGVDINSANLKELDSIPGITYPLARNIISYRKKYGNFTNWDDLLKVPGINSRILKEIKKSGKL